MKYTVFDFGEAIRQMRNGYSVQRPCWSPGEYVALQSPDENSKMRTPYLYIGRESGVVGPYSPSNEDILAMDWQLV